MYERAAADVYELIHFQRGKNWVDEAGTVAREIHSRCPEARALLDVACGTGAHLAAFAEHFAETHGVDNSPAMLEQARQRAGGAVLHEGDMRSFDLGRRFDAVVCLFASLAYMRDVAELNSAVSAMARHLQPGGVLVLEPWFFPEKFVDGYVAANLSRAENTAVGRFSHSVRKGEAVHMEVRFVRADSSGISDFTETHDMSLFTREEYLGAVAAAGCSAEFLVDALPGSATGLLVGVRG